VWEENMHHWVRLGSEIPSHGQGRTSKPLR